MNFGFFNFLKKSQPLQILRWSNGLHLMLTDVDECQEKTTDCEHLCINTQGSYHCGCRDGFSLRPDNRTCEPDNSENDDRNYQAATRDRCFASCDTVARLHDKINNLQEKVNSILY